MNKRLIDYINNIVFYEKKDSKEKRARIFYKGKGLRDVSYDEAIDICLELAKELDLRSIDEFKRLVNNKLIHVTTEELLLDRIDFYQEDNKFDIAHFRDENATDDNSIVEEDEENDEKFADNKTDEDYDIEDESTDDINDDEEFVDISAPDFNVTYEPSKKSSILSQENFDVDEEKKEKKGFFRRIVDKIKKNKVVKRVILCLTALAVGLDFYSCSSRKSLEGRMANSNLTSVSDSNKNNNDVKDDLLLIGDNSYYDNYNYETLQKVNTNEKQKSTMSNTYVNEI